HRLDLAERLEHVAPHLDELIHRLWLGESQGVDVAILVEEPVLRDIPGEIRIENDLSIALVQHRPLLVLRDELALGIEAEVSGPAQIGLSAVAANMEEAIPVDGKIE